MWRSCNHLGIAISNFDGAADQISLSIGDVLKIEYEYIPNEGNNVRSSFDSLQSKSNNPTWFRGFNLSASTAGMFPCNFVILKDTVNSNQNDDASTLQELAQVLRQWSAILLNLYKEGKQTEFRGLKSRMTQLVEWYHKIASPATAQSVRKELKDKVLGKIEEGKRLLGLDIILRTPQGQTASHSNVPVVSLYRMHQEVSASDLKADNNKSKQIAEYKPGVYRAASAASTSSNSLKLTSEQSVNKHLLLDLKIFMCSVGEPTEVFFSLYHKGQDKFLTEDFRVLLTGQGMPYDVSTIGKLKTLFSDISSRELSGGNVYLVCRLTRRGKLIFENKKEKTNEFRRPFGCAVLNLDDEMLTKIAEQEQEFTLPIYTSAQENQFAHLHDMLIKNKFGNATLNSGAVNNANPGNNPTTGSSQNQASTGIQEVPRAKGICIGLKTITTVDIKQHLASLSDDKDKDLKAISITPRFSLQDCMTPTTSRNDIFITVLEGEFTQDRKTSAKNCEVTVQVKLNNGDPVKDCICIGSADKGKPEYRSFVIYHCNAPHWNETIRLNIPSEVIDQAHLYFTVKHCSTSEGKDKGPGFAFAFLKLTQSDCAVIKDGVHSLETFKLPKSVSDQAFYLKPDSQKIAPSRKGEVIKIRIALTSTKLTQNSSMLSLLKWQHYQGNLADILNQFTYVDQLDIVKFLKETFDALFAILERNQSLALPVYNCIVLIINMLIDEHKRYYIFRPVLDAYIAHFLNPTPGGPTPASINAFGMAHKHLLTCLKQYIDQVDTNPANVSKVLIPTLKGLEYIFKFIISSRLSLNKKHVVQRVGSGTVSSGSAPTVLQASSNQKEDGWFKKDILDVLNGLNRLMCRKEKELIGPQILALKNFTNMLADLGDVFYDKELSSISGNFLVAIQYSETQKVLNTEKLNLMNKLVASELFTQKESRDILLPVVLQQLKRHIDVNNATSAEVQTQTVAWTLPLSREEIAESAKILHNILLVAQPNSSDGSLMSDQSCVKSMIEILPELLECFTAVQYQYRTLHSQTFDNTMVAILRMDLVTSILGIFYLLEPNDFTNFLKSKAEPDRSQLIYLTLKVIADMVMSADLHDAKKSPLGISSRDCYPSKWFAMIMFQLNTIKIMLETTSRTLVERVSNFAQENTLEYDIWVMFFEICLNYIQLPQLAVETFPESKKNLMKENTPDLRTSATQIFERLWNQLGNQQILFVKHMLLLSNTPILSLALTAVREIREFALRVYLTLLDREYKVRKSFTDVENGTIKVFHMMLDEKNTSIANLDRDTFSQFQALFVSSLEQYFSGNDNFHKQGRVFLEDMKQLLALLFSLRCVPQGEAYQDDRILATTRLMNYLKQTGRNDVYLEYAHILCHQHIISQNYVEAAMSLLLHSDLLEWNDTQVSEIQGGASIPSSVTSSGAVSNLQFPLETSRARKEKLIRTAIDYLDKGKLWEKAIDLIRELRYQYEAVVFDYPKLAEILQLEASLFRKLSVGERFFSNYFRVGFYGKGFDVSISSKEFIYRGYELERISDFTQRFQDKFPNAKLLTYTDLPPQDVRDSDGQYLQIFPVKATTQEEMEGKELSKKLEKEREGKRPLPPNVQKWFSENNVNVFLYSKPFKKTKSGNEFKDLWLCNTYFVAENAFPTIIRRSEVNKRVEVEVSPIENAINTVSDKNKELLSIITKYESKVATAKDKDVKENISPFTMVVKGVIDAGVNGGTEMYKNAFLLQSSGYLQDNPDKKDLVVKLKESLNDQIDILDKALAIHAKLCPEDMALLQQQLEMMFAKMKTEVKAS